MINDETQLALILRGCPQSGLPVHVYYAKKTTVDLPVERMEQTIFLKVVIYTYSWTYTLVENKIKI